MWSLDFSTSTTFPSMSRLRGNINPALIKSIFILSVVTSELKNLFLFKLNNIIDIQVMSIWLKMRNSNNYIINEMNQYWFIIDCMCYWPFVPNVLRHMHVVHSISNAALWSKSCCSRNLCNQIFVDFTRSMSFGWKPPVGVNIYKNHRYKINTLNVMKLLWSHYQ